MIEVRINGVAKWQVNEYTFNDPQMGLRSISLTVTHPSDNATVPSFVGAYVEYEGERYDIVNSKPTAEKGINSINYKYNLIFNGQEAELQRRKIRNLATVGVDTFISQGTSFSLYADINQFKQLLENNLKYYFGSKWTINLGSTTSESVMVSVNNMSIWDLLLKTFEYYGLRWTITGNTINIGYTPDVIQHVFDYGYSGGLVKITRTAQSEPTINRLIGVGGSRNVPINYFTNRYSDFPVDPNPISGDVNIKNIMPKVFRDSVIAGTLPYIDYVEDAALVAADGVKEDALEPNEEIYPSIAGVEVAGLGRIDQIIAASVPTANTPDDAGYSPTFDIWVKDIGFDLADNQYTATQDAKISFTSGMLAGYEFVILATNGVRNVVVDTSKSYGGVSSKYKITLINSSEDFTATGRMLPNSVIKAMAGDSFVIYDIIMPQNYVELAELRVQNWLNEQLLIKKVEKPTYAIEPTDTFFEENIAPESDGKTIREKLKSGNKLTVNNTKVTDGAQELHINNITIQYGGLLPKYSFVVTDKVSVQGSAIARLTNEIQKTDNSVQNTEKKIVKLQQYSDRQWKEIQETITLLGAAIDGFSTGINPITVQTMQLLVGNESLQFRFVSNKTTPVAVSHAFNWDDVLKSFTTTSGIIQHMTLGITEISSNHPVSAYKFWDIASYSNNTLVAEKPYYLYAKCSRTTSGAVFLLSDVPIGMYDDANYYYFLTGILNSENSDGGRSFVSLYGFTEILPGRITTDKIVSSDGLTYFDLLNGVIGGKIRFASTGGGETSLADWADGTSQDIQDTQAAANAAALKAQQAIDDAAANVTDYNAKFATVQAQIDGEVSNWFYAYSPTLANYPASEWTTNAIKDRHIGDTFTSIAQAPATDAGKSWRFVKNGSVYSWTLIADSDAVLALQKAALAQSTADGKSTTYLIQPTSYKLGDMWVLNADLTVNGTAYKQGEILTATQDSATYNQAHWLKRVRYTDDTAVNDLQIGTRNYFKNGKVNNSVTNTRVYYSNWLSENIPAGTKVSISVRVKSSAPVGGFAQYFNEANPYINFPDQNLTTDWKIFTLTRTLTSDLISSPSNTILHLRWSGTFTVNIDWICVVIGDKAMISFDAAPEDVEASIKTAKTEAENAAKAYADTKSEAERVLAEAYADGKVSAEEQARIDDVNAKLAAAKAHAEAQDALLKTQQEAYADGKISIAEQAAINAAKDYADLKKTEVQAYADGIVSDEEARAIADALDKFNASKAHAEQLVNNLEIGGRNLLTVQDIRDAEVSINNYSALQDGYLYGFRGSGAVDINASFLKIRGVIKGNGYYTISFKMRGTQGITQSLNLNVCGNISDELFFTDDDEFTNFSFTTKVDNYSKGGNDFVSFERLKRVFYLIDEIKLEKGNKATDWTEAQEDVEARINSAKLTAEGYMRARYVRDWIEGSNVNIYNNWTELKVVNKAGVNLALGKIPTHNGTVGNPSQYPLSNLTDNDTTTASYTYLTPTTPASLNYMQIDLGSIHYDIDYIHVWHYPDGRVCNNAKTQISEDGITWKTIFDSAIEGIYKETAEGKIHSQRWAKVMDKLVEASAKTKGFTRIGSVDFDSGLIFSNLMKLFDVEGSNFETAFISGITGTKNDLPAFGAGSRELNKGVYEQALSGKAGIIFRHNGTGKMGVFEVDEAGSVNIYDPDIADLLRLEFIKSKVPTVASLMSQTQAEQSKTNVARMFYSSSGSATLPNSVTVTEEGAELSFQGMMELDVSFTELNGAEFGSAAVGVYLYKDGSNYATLGGISAGRIDRDNPDFSSFVQLNKKLTVPKGIYTIVVSGSFSNALGSAGINNTSTLSWILRRDIRRFIFGSDGFASWYTENSFHFSELTGMFARGKVDIPAGLGGGGSAAGGVAGNWGRVLNANRVSSTTTINHSIGDLKYTVMVTPIGSSSTWYVQNKTANSVQIVCSGTFDYILVRTPY